MKDSYPEFQELLDKLPSGMGLCEIEGDHAVAAFLPDKESGKIVETMSSGIDYYILEQSEIETFSEWDYPANEKAYQDLAAYLRQLGVSPNNIWELCTKAFSSCANGNSGIDSFLDELTARRLLPTKKSEKERLTRIIIQVYENTRSYMLRGWKPSEMDTSHTIRFPGLHAGESSGQMPGCQPAAAVKAPVTAGKKIYPNDPCPCGSGLKYKKCCGKK